MYFSIFSHTPLSADATEAELILAAQSGDSTSMETLISAYLPGLACKIKLFRNVFSDVEDAEQEILAIFLGHLHKIDVTRDPSCGGYAGAVMERYNELLGQRGGFGGINRGTISAYTRLLRNANDALLPAAPSESEILDHVEEQIANLNEARRTAGGAGGACISFSQFRKVHAALSSSYSVLPDDEDINSDEASVETLEAEYALIRECVDRLPSDQRAVVRFAYGFCTPRDLTDAEVVEEWSRVALPAEQFEAGERITSRRTVARKHKDALGTLRDDFLAGFNGLDEDNTARVA